MPSDENARLRSWMLAIVLCEDPSGMFRVGSMELMFEGVKHQLKFSKRNRLFDVFLEPFAQELLEILGELGPKTHLFTDPDHEITVANATLVGLRVMRWKDDHRGRQTIVRFKYFVGAVDGLLRTRVPFTRSVLDHRERIAVEALADIATPLLGLARVPSDIELSQDQRDKIEAKLAAISDCASDLQFYISLLTRYVRECSEELPKPLAAPTIAPPAARLRLLEG